MKKTAALLLALMMLLPLFAVSSADALFDVPSLPKCKVVPMPSKIPTIKVSHNEMTNVYTVEASETPLWACANLWYGGSGHVDSITFNGKTATFKGTKAQIGLWWIGGPYNASEGVDLSYWLQKGEEEGQFADEAAVEAYAEETYPDYDSYIITELYRWSVNVNEFDEDGNWVGYIGGQYWIEPEQYGGDQEAFKEAVLAEFAEQYPEKILQCTDFEEFLAAWKLQGVREGTYMAYSGDDAILIGYPGMMVWYSRGGVPTQVFVDVTEDPFRTDKEFVSGSVKYENNGHWYISNITANYNNDPVAKVEVDYPDTMNGNWLRYTLTLSSGGVLKYTR